MPTGTRHKFLGGRVTDELAAGDDDGSRADRLDFFEDVGRQNDCLLLGHAANQLADFVLLVGIEPVGGLVEDQYFRVVNNRLGETHAAFESL